jgi:hypothetical protein
MGKTVMFGYRRGVPDGVRAVWGARLIAPNDLLHDRQDLVAESEEAKAELVKWLNGEPAGHGALSEALDRLRLIPLSGSTDEEVRIYEDATGIIVGNTQASYGYVYVCGYLKHHLPAVTKTGQVLTDEDFEALADEAERGYDVERLRRVVSDPKGIVKPVVP